MLEVIEESKGLGNINLSEFLKKKKENFMGFFEDYFTKFGYKMFSHIDAVSSSLFPFKMELKIVKIKDHIFNSILSLDSEGFLQKMKKIEKIDWLIYGEKSNLGDS